MKSYLLHALFFVLPLSIQAQCCDYKLVMLDSYGDSWNGATLQVLVNGNSFGTFSAQQYGTTVDIPVCNGDALSLVYNSGNYEEDNSYALQDASYNLLFSDGPFPALGNVFSTIVNCNTPSAPGIHPCVAIPLSDYTCYSVNTLGIPGSLINPNCGNFQGADIWYKIPIPATGGLKIETLAGNINDTGIAAYIGSSCNTLTQIGCDDDSGQGYLSMLMQFNLVPNDTLYVQAWRWGGGSGTFELCFTPIENVSLVSSNLPILIIETDINAQNGQQFEIVDEPKVPATMKLIFRPDGSQNFMTDIANPAFLNYNGRIAIEIRGSTSQLLPKKPYGFTTTQADNTTNNNVSLLGMPEENDWILNALAFDPSMIRDIISYDLSRNLGNYAPRGKYVEVIINGDYKGVYVLMEKIKRDNSRVNVFNMTTAHNSLPELSGGYIVKCDKLTGGDEVAWTMPGVTGNAEFIYYFPKPELITLPQSQYIQNYFQNVSNKTNPANAHITSGYPDLIDIPSFIDFMLMAEISSNVDAYHLSTYLHKDQGGKLRAGPIWDYNLTFGNDLTFWGYDRSKTDVWQFNNVDNNGAYFWLNLFNDPTYKCLLARRWFETTTAGKPLNYQSIEILVDYYTNLLNEAAQREQTRWGTVGTRIENVQELKNWLLQRMSWMNANIGNPTACLNPSLPNLVISKIHYNPMAQNGFLSTELEFIEITNNSNTTVDLSGIYIRELGISYKFPASSSIGPNQKLMLASNAQKFNLFYGFQPFDSFNRTLSNKDYPIVLCDALGNIIDQVHYFDAAPWPSAADGNGPYLKLVDINSDNSLAENWIASSGFANLDYAGEIVPDVLVFPNPVKNEVSIVSEDFIITKVIIHDLQGREIFEYFFRDTFDVRTRTIDTGNLDPGVYVLNLNLDGGIIIKKAVVKC